MRFGRWLGALALTSAALAFVVPGSAPVRADGANQECTNNEDITVVIDFQNVDGLDEGVNVRCAPQEVPSGRAALVRANIAFNDYRGFVCRISGLPKAGPCNTYPPANAYWVYWLAQRGGQWCAANLGFDARTPPPGTLEGWSFALKKGSSTAPPPRYPVPGAIPGTTPRPLNGGDCSDEIGTPPVPPTTTTNQPAGPTQTSTTPTNSSGGEPSATSTTRRSAGATTTVVTAPGETTTSSLVDYAAEPVTTSSVPFGDADLSVSRADDDGSPWGVIIGIGVIVGVVGTSLVFLSLRRRNEFG